MSGLTFSECRCSRALPSATGQQTFSNAVRPPSAQTLSFGRGSERDGFASYAPACFSDCAGIPQTIRSGRVVR